MESQHNLLEGLTEQQQLEVYDLMGITNIEDANVAARLYIDSDYDMNRAVQRFFDRQTGGGAHSELEEYDIPPADEHDRLTGGATQRVRTHDSDPHTQYKQFLERKQQEEAQKGIVDTVKWGVGGVFYVVKSVLRYVVPTFIRGETAGGEQFRNFWAREFADLPNHIQFSTGTFEENANYAESYTRPLLVYHHNPQSDPAIIRRIFANRNLVDLMNSKFHVLGLLSGTEEAQKADRLVEPRAQTYLAVFRVNLLEEICLVEAIPFDNDATPQRVLEHLRNCESSYSIIHAEENRIKQDVDRSLDEQRRRNMQMNIPSYVSYDQFVQNPRRNQQQNANPNREEEQRRLEEARLLRQVQDEEFKEVERKIQQQQREKADADRLARETAEREEQHRRQREEEARIKLENKENIKKLKLAAVPAEPAENDPSAVLILFRLPDGNRIERRFKSSDPAQALYDYVDTKDIQFDPSTKNFDLMQPRPFLCLDDKNKTIGEYFEGSNSEVVTIRELTE